MRMWQCTYPKNIETKQLRKTKKNSSKLVCMCTYTFIFILFIFILNRK